MVHLLVYNRTMKRLNVHEAKTHLSEHLDLLARGETIILCRRNVPVAEIRPLPSGEKRPRRIGLAKGKVRISRKFFEPLPDSVLKGFLGGE